MNKITHVAWLNGGCIGVVRVETMYDPPKYYIKAIGQTETINCFPRTEKSDAVKVAHWGHQLDYEIGNIIIEKYGKVFEIEYS